MDTRPSFSICYSTTLNTRVIGDANWATVDKLGLVSIGGGLYSQLNVAYHGALAVLASSLVLQGGAGKFGLMTGVLFIILWTIGVYAPLTHWQSAKQGLVPGAPATAGWLSAGGGGYGLLDHAGAHHISMAAGASSLVITLLTGAQGKAITPSATHKNVHHANTESFNAALWSLFGYAGYLVMGDPNSASGGSGPALLNLILSVSAAVLTAGLWEVVYNHGKFNFHGKPSTVTVITSVHYGLVAVTAGASIISPMWASFFGFLTVAVCYALNAAADKFSLSGLGTNSVFSIHFLGAAMSSALTGLFANPSYGHGASGAYTGAGSFYGNPVQLGRQCAGISVTLLVSAVSTVIIYCFVLAISKVLGNTTLSLEHVEHHEEEAKADKPLTSAA